MKLTKIFGIVLSLHVGVILLVMFQPSCNTLKKGKGDQNGTTESSPPETGVNAAFNAGTKTEDSPSNSASGATGVRSSPTRPKPGELIVPGGIEPISNPDTGDRSEVGLRPEGVNIYKITRGDTLWGIARKNNVSLNALLGANPGLNKNASLTIGQEVLVPGSETSISGATESPSRGDPTVVSPGATSYTVKKGDYLTRIASSHGISLQALRAANGISGDTIQVGQTLVIPGGGDSIPSSPTPVSTQKPSLGANTYTVRSGDNLSRIAATYGTTVAKLLEINELSDANSIRVGQVLSVSGSLPPSIPLVHSPNDPVPTTSDPVLTPATPDPNLEDFFKNDPPPVLDAPEE
jgi:LysM repeat protein